MLCLCQVLFQSNSEMTTDLVPLRLAFHSFEWRALPPHCSLLSMLWLPWAHTEETVFTTHVLPTDDSHVREPKNNCIYKVLATDGFVFFSWYPVLFSAIDGSSRASFPLVSHFFFSQNLRTSSFRLHGWRVCISHSSLCGFQWKIHAHGIQLVLLHTTLRFLPSCL